MRSVVKPSELREPEYGFIANRNHLQVVYLHRLVETQFGCWLHPGVINDVRAAQARELKAALTLRHMIKVKQTKRRAFRTRAPAYA